MYEYLIGLEIHVKLNSENKLFCQCKNQQEFDELEPNTNICPVCTWQVWALPVLNKEPLQKAMLLGYALNCEVNKESSFDRKSYFYPDLPMWYQITQFERPVNGEWYVYFYTNNYQEENKARIERAHMEADAGKTIHEWDNAKMDYNRSGTPLVEIVTYPDFASDEQVVEFLKELQRLVRFNNIWNADMEKGQLRVDVNISVRKQGETQLGNKVELKNINSFGAIKRAINAEFERQKELLEEDNEIQQQTRWWDDELWESYLMRSKEDALDYRYFPEPDMPPVQVDDNFLEEVKSQKVESVFSRIKRYKEEYGFHKEFINALIQTSDINNFFEKTVEAGIDPKISAKWITWEVIRYLNDNNLEVSDLKFDVHQFIDFLKWIQSGEIIEAHAKQIIKEMINTWKSSWDIIEEKGLKPVDTSEIENIVKEVIDENPQAVEDYKNWQEKSIGFMIGQVMKKSQWKADPKQARSIMEQYLSD